MQIKCLPYHVINEFYITLFSFLSNFPIVFYLNVTNQKVEYQLMIKIMILVQTNFEVVESWLRSLMILIIYEKCDFNLWNSKSRS